MKAFLITHTLESDDSCFSQLITRIKNSPKWARISNFCWIIVSESDVVDIRTQLKQGLEASFSLAVFEISNCAWATYSVSKEVTDWMKSNV